MHSSLQLKEEMFWEAELNFSLSSVSTDPSPEISTLDSPSNINNLDNTTRYGLYFRQNHGKPLNQYSLELKNKDQGTQLPPIYLWGLLEPLRAFVHVRSLKWSQTIKEERWGHYYKITCGH